MSHESESVMDVEDNAFDAEETAPARKSKRRSSEVVEKDRYFRVRFHAKSNSEASSDVQLSVNGETIIMQREEEVVIPERYVKVARNATFQIFRQLPGEPRKVVGKLMLYPFDMIGEATEAEFLQMKRDGTKATKEANETQG